MATSTYWDSTSNARYDYPNRFVSALLYNDFKSDLTFLLQKDGTSIRAHLIIVAVASPVFNKKCSIDTNGENVITVPEAYSGDAFKVVLKHLYAGSGLCEIGTDNALEVMKVADFFGLLNLQNQCASVLEKTLNCSNVCKLFEQCHLMENDFKPICLKYLGDHAEQLLTDGTLMQMPHSAVKLVLDQDSLAADETIVIESMIKWAILECQQHDLVPDPKQLRELLKTVVFSVRFPIMTIAQFKKSVKLMGADFLAPNEVFEITEYIENHANQSQLSGKFSILPRSHPMMEKNIGIWSEATNYTVKDSEIFSFEVEPECDPDLFSLIGFTIKNGSTLVPLVIINMCSKPSVLIDFTYDSRNRRVIFSKPLYLDEYNKCSIHIVSSVSPFTAFKVEPGLINDIMLGNVDFTPIEILHCKDRCKN